MRSFLLVATISACISAEARPFRAMVTRTAETEPSGRVELNLRYQGFYAGVGHDEAGVRTDALPYSQIAPGVRWAIVHDLEMSVEVDGLLLDVPGGSRYQLALGDIPVGLQWSFLDTRRFAMAVFLRGTVPTGPSQIDAISPLLSDGTFDAEATLIAELRPTRTLRLMMNLGYLYNGVRDRTPRESFDVPDALRADLALTFNPIERVLLGVELVTRYFFSPVITPVWRHNDLLIEAIPHARFEVAPAFVLEAAVGIAVSQQLREMYGVRALLGFTYELGG